MKEFLIGRYQLGWRFVNLYAMPEERGGWFNICREGKEAQIHVGMSYPDCAHAFAVLCHETWEACMDDNSCIFKPKLFEENASDGVHFFFNHNQHTEIQSRCSWFIWTCMEDFKKAHAKIVKKSKKK